MTPEGASQKLLGGLLLLLAKLPPEGIALVAELVQAMARAKDPMRAVRLAVLAAAGKKASEEIIEKAIGK